MNNITKQEALKKLELLEKETLELRKIIEKKEELIARITTIEQVYAELGKKMLTINDFSFLPVYNRVKALNFQHIQAIAELFNEGWKPDWNNNNEYKYYPYFQFGSGGWSFYFYRNYCCCAGGVPAFYKNEKIATYVGKTFLPIYADYLNN